MDPLSVLALATQCVTAAPAPVVAAVAIAQTDGAPYAVTIGGERNSPADFDAAVQTVALALTSGSSARIGMAGVPVSAFDDRGVSYTHGFSACSNLAVAGELLSESWQRFGGMEEHWRLAVLEYATGKAGTEGAFAEKFDAAMAEIKKVAGELPDRQVTAHAAEPPRTERERPAPSAVQANAHDDVGWDVFNRDRSRSLLIYSK